MLCQYQGENRWAGIGGKTVRGRAPADIQNYSVPSQAAPGWLLSHIQWLAPRSGGTCWVSLHLPSPATSPSITHTPEAQFLFFVPLKSIQDQSTLSLQCHEDVRICSRWRIFRVKLTEWTLNLVYPFHTHAEAVPHSKEIRHIPPDTSCNEKWEVMRLFIMPCPPWIPQYMLALSYTPQQLISGGQNSIHSFAVAKYTACSPTQTNEETRQVARFSELSLIKAIYVLIVLLDYKNWKGEERTVNCTIYFMEWKIQQQTTTAVKSV